jgi:hypothetical protein
MADKIYVRPGAGRTVKVGVHTLIGEGVKGKAANTPAHGVRVTKTTYITRRLKCGDLVLATVAPPEHGAAKPVEAAAAPPAPTVKVQAAEPPAAAPPAAKAPIAATTTEKGV